MNNGLFHFKRFSVAHGRSSMKVGVDAVLLGAWADSRGYSMLDVGTGCGVIALMMAQRNREAEILAIDVDSASVEEAACNFGRSQWSGRLRALHMPFAELVREGGKFDRIVSNPPYFDSGVTDFTTSRNVARHQGALSPSVLIRESTGLLTYDGRLSMIAPSEFFGRLCEDAVASGLNLIRACFVRGNPRKQPKRVMMEFGALLPDEEAAVDCLTMFDGTGAPSEEYRLLGREFYLKF